MQNVDMRQNETFSGPLEFLGKDRSDVKLIHGDTLSGDISLYDSFNEIVKLFRKGDLLIFNDSLTIPSSLYGYLREHQVYGRLHVGQPTESGRLLVEIRPKELNLKIEEGDTFIHPESGTEFLLEKRFKKFPRYFEATHTLKGKSVKEFLSSSGGPIFYEGYTTPFPIQYYRNVFQTVPGSSEYPSASRPFTNRILNTLHSRGILTGTLTLHCNLGSLERIEYKYGKSLLEERYIIPQSLVEEITTVRSNVGRVIAVGTTVVRALVSSLEDEEMIRLAGNTDIKIGGNTSIWPLDGVISGMHEQESSHLELLEAFGGSKLLMPIGRIASEFNLRGHEFGDSMLIL